jgi:hypothetical protein
MPDERSGGVVEGHSPQIDVVVSFAARCEGDLAAHHREFRDEFAQMLARRARRHGSSLSMTSSLQMISIMPMMSSGD